MKLQEDAFLPLFMTDTLYAVPNQELVTVVPASSTAEPAVPEAPAAPVAETPTPAIETPATAPEPSNPVPPLEYLGENRKQVVILVHYPDVTFLPDEHRAFLGKILQAVKLDWADVALYNLAHSPADAPGWSGVTAKQVIAFGVNHPWVGDTPPYQNTPVGTRTVLRGDSLASISTERNHKAALWGALQALFPAS